MGPPRWLPAPAPGRASCGRSSAASAGTTWRNWTICSRLSRLRCPAELCTQLIATRHTICWTCIIAVGMIVHVPNIRLLCLHGYHGSADIMRRQLGPLVDGLDVPVEFVYVDAPSLAVGDFGWWHLNFQGWERTRDWAVDLFEREPRFDGVFGFSQGAALTALLVGMRASEGNVSEQRPL